jgi:SARP family transcriptional regulator, regulator of embCAB operon
MVDVPRMLLGPGDQGGLVVGADDEAAGAMDRLPDHLLHGSSPLCETLDGAPGYQLGESLAKTSPFPLRVYLTGRVAVELRDGLLDERELPGRQGRLALVYLVFERDRPVPRDELADALWGEALPPAWDSALSALVSKLRGLLAAGGAPGRSMLETAAGAYHLRLPPGAWVDVEAAQQSLDQAEGALRAGRPGPAGGHASVAVSIARRPLLAGLDAEWIRARREALGHVLVRALDCLAEVALASREPRLAAQLAAEVVRLEPYRESAYQLLMRAHAAAGDRAHAVRAYAECRRLLLAELGVGPSPQTEAVYHALLGRR